jgi:glyoxylase-like metal-dependent hydrolase (beta-lactamase superfamily II)
MAPQRLLNRRVAIKEMGKAGLAIVVFGGAACSDVPGTASSSITSSSIPSSSIPSSQSTPTAPAPQTTAGEDVATTTTAAAAPGLAFQRVDLGFVSAYILYRAGEAALVDTGVDGSADAIESALTEAGLGWGRVGHVILTHEHPDHVGSIDAVLARAPGAAVYAGALDIPNISATVEPSPVGDGDIVFDLEIIETPGHTAGHISVFDREAGILVVGDALNGQDGGVVGPDPGFSENMPAAIDSVRKLAGLTFEVALFGHGEPLLDAASAAVAALASESG